MGLVNVPIHDMLEFQLQEADHLLVVCRSKLVRVAHDMTEQQMQDLAATAHGFVGADLAALAQEASLAALRRIIAARTGPSQAFVHGEAHHSQMNQRPIDTNGFAMVFH